MNGASQIERTLTQKSDKVDCDREELIAKHHDYAGKAGIGLDDEEMQAFITEKIDNAVDIVDEATLRISELHEAVQAREENAKNVLQQRQSVLEISAARQQSESYKRLVEALVAAIDDVVAVDEPQEEEALKVETYLCELQEREQEMTKSWSHVTSLLADEAEIAGVTTHLEATLTQILLCRREAKVFIARIRGTAPTSSTGSTPGSHRASASQMKLQRAEPPKFSGDIREYARFKADFEQIVMKEHADAVYQVYVMKNSCLSGDAYKLVRNIDNLPAIWERLKERYGDTNTIVDAVLQELQDLHVPSFKNQDQGVLKLIETLERGVQDLSAINKRGDIANSYTVGIVEKKLPRRVMLKWLEEEDEVDGDDRFEKLLEYLKKERKRTSRLLQQSREKDRGKEGGEKENKGRDEKKKEKVHSLQEGKSHNLCIIHPNSRTPHFTRRCKEFLKKTVEERAQLVKDLQACVLCLSLTHPNEPCPRKDTWEPCGVDDCQEMHSKFIHGAPAINMHIFQITAGVHIRTLLLMQEVSSESGKIFAFWDNGSSISLVSASFVKKHQLRGVRVSYDLVTINQEVRPQETTLYDIALTDRRGVKHVISAYEIEEICEETAFYNSGISKIFKNVKPSDVKRPRCKVELLVGMDNIGLHPKIVECKANLALFSSQFGTGKLIGGQHPTIKGSDKMNAHAKMVAHGTRRNVRVQSVAKDIFSVRDPKCIDFFEAENMGVSLPRNCTGCEGCPNCTFIIGEMSRIMQQELKVIKEGMTLDPVKQRWVVSYPYIVNPASVLKDNRQQALSILLRLEKRLQKSETASDCYRKQFKDFIDRGVWREISQDEIVKYDGPVHYTTHHEVFNEGSASTPVRIVSNSSLKYEGVSHNDILMKGPNCLNDLYSIVLRFRVHPIAIVGDISKMYHSVATTEKEKHLRRVLWRDMQLSESPKTYVTEVVAFGDRPAAAITAVAIKETASLYSYIDENAAQKIKNDMYVDDLTSGVDKREEVESTKTNITRILEKGGFRIKGFVVSGDSSEEALSVLGAGEVGRVLGVGWDPTKDEFCIRVRVNTSKKVKGARTATDLLVTDIPQELAQKLTRSLLLGITNSIYDILGFLIPLTIILKLIIRETHKKELALKWQDELPSNLKERVIKVLILLKEAEKLRFNRCITPSNAVGDPMLITFNDGSSLAMCAAAYIRWELQSGDVMAQLIAAKARVTPIERMTTPRSEMQSGVLGVRLSKAIQKACNNLKFDEIVHISDSECTIASLQKDSTALKEFMGNRVSEIMRLTEISQWNHTKSANNSADIGTRANATVEDVKQGSTWHDAPNWIKLKREDWPVTVATEIGSEHIPKEEIINPKQCFHVTTHPPLTNLSEWRMRTYTLLMQSTARVCEMLSGHSFRKSIVTPTSLEKAENYWISQSMILTKEALDKRQLSSLRPQFDENGVIVLGSRALKGFKTNYNRDRFPILTSKDPLAFLWMKHIHDEDHTGRTKTVAKSRRKFWIVRAGKVFEKVKSSCFRCKLLDKELAMQQMSALPECRLTAAPVFHVISIDLFGPLSIKDMVKKRTTMKVWGFIASCTATRAIHLDVTESYSTDAILQAIEKFKRIRRHPSEIISDQGSQMKAAAKEMTKGWDWSRIS